jgi:MFS family permease
MILTAILFFLAGSILCAVAENFTHMLVGRSIQGIGGGGIIALTEIVVTDLVPLRLRGQYFGFISSMWSLGSVLGPVLGGGFAEDVSWVSSNPCIQVFSLVYANHWMGRLEMDLLY